MYHMAEWTPIILIIILIIAFICCVITFARRDDKIIKYNLWRLNRHIRFINSGIWACILGAIGVCIVGLIIGSIFVDNDCNAPTINKLNQIECAYQAPKKIKHNEHNLKKASHNFSDFYSMESIKLKIYHEKSMKRKYGNYNLKKIHKPGVKNYL